MTFKAHSSSVIEAGARVGDGALIGPFCHIGPRVEIGRGVEIVSHVVLCGDAKIGDSSKIYPFASIGTRSQDLKAEDDEGKVRLGAGCIVREGVTINAGTRSDGVTTLGERCALLTNSHVAHDCRLGDGVVLSNNVALGGHVSLGDHVNIGGGSAVHQFVRIGSHCFVAGLSGVESDAPPYTIVGGNRAHLFGLNAVGLGRHGFAPERIERLRRAYRMLYARKDPSPIEDRLEEAANLADDDGDIAELLAFLRAPSSRPAMAPRPSRAS